MSTGMVERQDSAAGGTIVKPQSVGMTQASQRVVAEAQAALTVAKASRRDEVDAIDRIKNTCQRLGVAEKAEYSFARGGTAISGASIRLLEVIAAAWGNIQCGFRELSRSNGESIVEAFAWDLETNNKKVMEFTVRHWRDTKSGGHAIKDERDIYELIANMAQRRVRKCMEAVIPRDVIDDALEECHKTLKAKCELTPQRITGMAAKFASEYSITKEQIEKKIQRRLEAITQAQFLEMMRIYNSLRDGMSKPGEWFEVEEEEAPETTTDAIKAKLQKSAPPESQSSPSLFDSAVAAVEQSTDPISCKAAFDGWIPKLSEPDQADLNTAYQQKLATFPTSKKKNQGGLPLNP
jgi:hypothetical protein